MNAELVCFRLLAVLRTSSKTDSTKFVCLRKVLLLLRSADSRELCTKLCYESFDVFRYLLLPLSDDHDTGNNRSSELDDARCASVAVLCLREMCRSRVEGVDEGLRLALAGHDILFNITNLLLKSTYNALHSVAITFFVEMAQDATVLEAFGERWMSISDSIMTLLNNESLACKRTAMCTIICLLNDKLSCQVGHVCPPENPWIWNTLPQLYRVMLSIRGPPAARFEAAECFVLIHLYSCRELVLFEKQHNVPTNALEEDEVQLSARKGLAERCLAAGDLISILFMISTDTQYHPFLVSNSWHIGQDGDNHGSKSTHLSSKESLVEQKESIRQACHLLRRIIDEDSPRNKGPIMSFNSSHEDFHMKWNSRGDDFLSSLKLQWLHSGDLLESLVYSCCSLQNQIGDYSEMSGVSDSQSPPTQGEKYTIIQELQASLEHLYDILEIWISADGECAWRMSMLLRGINRISTATPCSSNNNAPHSIEIETRVEEIGFVELLKSLHVTSRNELMEKCYSIRSSRQSEPRKAVKGLRSILDKARRVESRSNRNYFPSPLTQDGSSRASMDSKGIGMLEIQPTRNDDRHNDTIALGVGYKSLLSLFQRNGFPDPNSDRHYRHRHQNCHHHHRKRSPSSNRDGSGRSSAEEVDTGDNVDMKPVSDAEIYEALVKIGRVPPKKNRSEESKQRRVSTKPPIDVNFGSPPRGRPIGFMSNHFDSSPKFDQFVQSITDNQRILQQDDLDFQSLSPARQYTIENPVKYEDMERYTFHADKLRVELNLVPAKSKKKIHPKYSELSNADNTIPRHPSTMHSRSFVPQSPIVSSRRLKVATSGSPPSRLLQHFSPSPHTLNNMQDNQILSAKTVSMLGLLASCDFTFRGEE